MSQKIPMIHLSPSLVIVLFYQPISPSTSLSALFLPIAASTLHKNSSKYISLLHFILLLLLCDHLQIIRLLMFSVHWKRKGSVVQFFFFCSPQDWHYLLHLLSLSQAPFLVKLWCSYVSCLATSGACFFASIVCDPESHGLLSAYQSHALDYNDF